MERHCVLSFATTVTGCACCVTRGWARAQLDDGIYKDFTKDQAFKNPGEAGYRPKPPPATASAAPARSLTRAPRSRPARLLVSPSRSTLFDHSN